MRLFFLLFLVLAGSVTARAQVPATSPLVAAHPLANASYAELFARAQALRAEQSWALAEEHFEAAERVAKTEVERETAALGALECRSRAARNLPWQAREAFQARWLEQWQKLVAPFAKGRPRDEFWVRLQMAEFEFRSQTGENSLASLEALWEFLNQQPKSESSVALAMEIARRTVDLETYGSTAYGRLVSTQLNLLQRVVTRPEDRAWLAWKLARKAGPDFESEPNAKEYLIELQARWEEAKTAARGTRLETLVEMEAFLAVHEIAALPADPQPLTPAQLKEKIAEGDRLGVAANASTWPPEIANRWQNLRRSWTEPRLLVMAPERISEQEPVVLSFGALGLTSLQVRVVGLTTEEILERLWEQRRPVQKTGSVGQVVWSHEVTLGSNDPLAWNSRKFDGPQTLPLGTYEVVWRGQRGDGEELLQRSLLQVGRWRLGTVSTNRSGAGVMIFDPRTQEPARGQNVVLTWRSDSGDSRAQVTTDDTGFAAVDFGPGQGQLVLVAQIGEQTLANSENLWRYSSSRAEVNWTGDLTLDRPLYRPGETVHWRLVAREGKAGAWKLPAAERPVSVKFLTGRDEQVLWQGEKRWSEFGTMEGAFDLPANLRPSQGHLVVTQGDKSEPILRHYAAFQVDRFDPPAAKVKLDLSSPVAELRPGRTVRFEASAEYLSGSALVGAKVEFSLGASWYEAGQEPTAEWSKWRDAIGQRKWLATTDVKGRAELNLDLPDFVPAFASIRVMAKVLPQGGTGLETEQSYLISPSGCMLERASTPLLRAGEVGQPFTFETRILDGRGQPSAFVGEATLERLRWHEIWQKPDGALATPEELREGRRGAAPQAQILEGQGWVRLHEGYAVTQEQVKKVEVGTDGKLATAFTLPREGLYRVRLWRDGVELKAPSLGGGFRDQTSLFPPQKGEDDNGLCVLAIATGQNLALPPAARGFLDSGKSEGLSGRVFLPEQNEGLWLVLSTSESLISLPLVRQGRIGTYALPKPLGEFPRSWQLRLISEGGWNEPSRAVRLPGDWPRLTATLQPGATTQRPGAATRATLHVTDRSGRPVRAELHLSVADQAVRALAGQTGKAGTLPFFREPVAEAPRAQVNWRNPPYVPGIFADPRSVMGGPQVNDDEFIELSPFSVESGSLGGAGGYKASNTLAGTRLRTELRDVGSANFVVSKHAEIQPAPPRSVASQTVLGQGQADLEAVNVRTHFSSTAFWSPKLVTDEQGRVDVVFNFPDDLTEWHWDSLAVGADGQSFGRVELSTRTDLPFQARLRWPESLVAGDRVEPRAVLVNLSERPVPAEAELQVGKSIQKMDTLGRRVVTVPAQAETAATWSVTVDAPGPLRAVLRAAAGSESDGMTLQSEVKEDGILQPTYLSLALSRGSRSGEGLLPLPKPLDRNRASAGVRIDVAGVGALVDAIPYLVNYPYGCVEQTLNRFLPAVALRAFLRERGVPEAAIEARLTGADVGAGSAEKAATLETVIEAGLARLEDAKIDEGFGWWPEAPSADLWMTAYVAWGLGRARAAGVEVPEELLEHAFESTRMGLMGGEGSAETRAWALAALVEAKVEDQVLPSLQKAWNDLFGQRAHLAPSGLASLLLAAEKFGNPTAKDLLLRNLHNGALKAEALGMPVLHWEGRRELCRASDTPVEATAMALLALLQVAPRDERIDPAAHWLLLNRRGSRWDSTRSTALAVLALQRWLASRTADSVSEKVEVLVDGKVVATVALGSAGELDQKAEVSLPPEILREEGIKVQVRRVQGKSPLFVTAWASAWARGDAVKPFAQVLGVTREWRRHVPIETLRGELKVVPEALATVGTVRRDEVVQARVSLRTVVDLEYLKIEVPLPGGARPAALLSGWDARLVPAGSPEDEGRPVYREAAVGSSVFFLPELPAGEWVLVFDLRAEIGGDYRTLPTEAEAMYVPEVRGNTDARRVVITERP